VTEVTVALKDVRVVDCNDQAVEACSDAGTVLCPGLLGDCDVDGDVDLFDVLHNIDIVLGRIQPTAVERVLCDTDCDGDIDIFDIMIQIDVLLERRSLPLTCPPGLTADLASDAAPTTAERRRSPHVDAQHGGRSVTLKNQSLNVRGLELTFTASRWSRIRRAQRIP
jgi:hypothetical protein